MLGLKTMEHETAPTFTVDESPIGDSLSVVLDYGSGSETSFFGIRAKATRSNRLREPQCQYRRAIPWWKLFRKWISRGKSLVKSVLGGGLTGMASTSDGGSGGEETK